MGGAPAVNTHMIIGIISHSVISVYYLSLPQLIKNQAAGDERISQRYRRPGFHWPAGVTLAVSEIIFFFFS